MPIWDIIRSLSTDHPSLGVFGDSVGDRGGCYLISLVSSLSCLVSRRRGYYEEEDKPGCASDARGQRLLASHSGSASSEFFHFSQHTFECWVPIHQVARHLFSSPRPCLAAQEIPQAVWRFSRSSIPPILSALPCFRCLSIQSPKAPFRPVILTHTGPLQEERPLEGSSVIDPRGSIYAGVKAL